MRRVLLLALLSAALLACGSPEDVRDPRADAEAFLELLSERQWERAAERCALDAAARIRFGLPEGTPAAVTATHVADLFEAVYGVVTPGPVMAVDIDPFETGDRALARVTYRHGDLDAFYLRRVDGRWLYSFDGDP